MAEKQLPTTTKEKFTEFELDALNIHNAYRRIHGVPDLKLNKKMCDYAQEWADTCAKTGKFAHRPNNQYGENIFFFNSSDKTHVPTAQDAVKSWYEEVKQHKFEKETVNNATLHFTQVIWKGCTELGFAMAKGPKAEFYVVANYHPRGNCVGKFVENVPKPLKK